MQSSPKANGPDCPRCGAPGPETFWYMRNQYLFDVDKARQIVLDGRETVELEPADIEFCVRTSEIDECHVPHVDVSIPGIVSHIWFQDEHGSLIHGHVVIDGHHRAARCLKDGSPFFVHLLSESESRAILLKSPRQRSGPRRVFAT